jgi:serine protease Do
LTVFFLAAPVWAQNKPDSKVLKMFEDLQEVIISLSNSVKQSVVHIEVVQKQDDLKFKSLASGLIVDEKGYILTNEHVVDKATSVMVTLANKLEYPAEIIGVDKQTDLALLKIEAPEKLAVSKLGNSDKVQVGEWVIAVGNPYGFDRKGPRYSEHTDRSAFD